MKYHMGCLKNLIRYLRVSVSFIVSYFSRASFLAVFSLISGWQYFLERVFTLENF